MEQLDILKKPPRSRVKLTETPLTSVQKRQWEETLAAVNWVTPGFAHIMYTMLNKRGDSQVAVFTEAFPFIAGTDGSQLIFNPKEFFKVKLMARVFIVAHEIMHCVYDHCGVGYRLRKQGIVTWAGRTLPYCPEAANCIQDYIINDGLIESKTGEWPGFGLHDKEIATHQDSWVEQYFKHVKVMPPQKGKKKGKGQGGQGKDQDGQGGPGLEVSLPGLNPDGSVTQTGKEKSGSKPEHPTGDQLDDGIDKRVGLAWDGHLDPGMIDEQKPNEAEGRSAQAWEQAVAAALTISRAQGKLPAALEHMFNSVLEPKVDWRDHIHGILARKVGSGGYDYRKPDRRLLTRDIVIPGRSGHGVDCVVLAADSSGSIYCDPDLLDQWLGECQGLMEDLRPRRLILIWCDAEVQRVDELTDAGDLEWVRHKGAKGGGGTDFRPVFDWIEANHIRPDALLYLTDLEGDFPEEEPRYPVIWGAVKDHPVPFGDKVMIPYNPKDD